MMTILVKQGARILNTQTGAYLTAPRQLRLADATEGPSGMYYVVQDGTRFGIRAEDVLIVQRTQEVNHAPTH